MFRFLIHRFQLHSVAHFTAKTLKEKSSTIITNLKLKNNGNLESNNKLSFSFNNLNSSQILSIAKSIISFKSDTEKIRNLTEEYAKNKYASTYHMAKALINKDIAKTHFRLSFVRYFYKQKAINQFYLSQGVSQRRNRIRNAFLCGMIIWSISGLKNTNVSGIRSVWLTFAKLFGLNAILSPLLGSKYIDIPISVCSYFYSNGLPVLHQEAKKGLSFQELILLSRKIKNIKKEIATLKFSGFRIKALNLEKELERLQKEYKYNLKLQTDNIKYASKGNWRSVARIITLCVILGLLASTGGISLLVNGLIMLIGHVFYAVACAMDTDVQNNYTIWLNLKRANLLKEDVKQEDFDKIINELKGIINHKKSKFKFNFKFWLNKFENKQIEELTYKIAAMLDEDKIKALWVNSNDTSKEFIKNIIDHKSSKLCVGINKYIGTPEFLFHNNIRKLENLATQQYLFDSNQLDKLERKSLVRQCLIHQNTKLLPKAINAAIHTTYASNGQTAKNYGPIIASSMFAFPSEILAYGGGLNSKVNNTLYNIGKASAGIISPSTRSFSSAQRVEAKKILSLDLGTIQEVDCQTVNENNFATIYAKLNKYKYAINKSGKAIITELSFIVYDGNKQTEIVKSVIDSTPQSKRFESSTKRYIRVAKASWLSAKAPISILKNLVQVRQL